MPNRPVRLCVLLLTFAPSPLGAQLLSAAAPTHAECANAVARAADDTRAVVREGLLAACGRAGSTVIASAIQSSTNDTDQDYFSKLADVSPRSGLVFDAALGLATNPAALPEARVGAMRILAKQLLGDGGELDVMGGMKGLASPNPFCHIRALGPRDTTSVDGDPLPADYEARVRESTEAIARAPANDLVVRNAARCVRNFFKPLMLEPLDASTIAITNVCEEQFRIKNTGTRSVILTFDVAGKPARTKINAPVGESVIVTDRPGLVQLYYGDRKIASAASRSKECELRHGVDGRRP